MVQVSVVVPVYNPGRYLDDLSSSLTRQSMALEDFEVVFVDDGSTDGTPQRLAALALQMPNVRVRRIPNSGWPGRPRNVGVDMARGEYVMFVDHDDELGDEALERMYRYAKANDSDVVVGKEGRRHQTWNTGPLFQRNRPRAALETDPELLLLLTPHKMFRRAFLDQHDLRFLEGPRRLEDHQFVMRAYFRAANISVLADYTCYYWRWRPDSASRAGKLDIEDYYRSLRDVLDVVEVNTTPGPFRDRLLVHWYRTKVLKRLGPNFSVHGESYARKQFDSMHKVALERFPPQIDDTQLGGLNRLRSALLRAGVFSGARRLAALERALTLSERVDHFSTNGNRLELGLTAELRHGDGTPTLLERSGERLLLVLPEDLTTEDLSPSARDMTTAYDRFRLTVYARQRGADQRFALAGSSDTDRSAGGPTTPVRATARAIVDPAVLEEGRPMRAGLWWLEAELTFGGAVVRRPIRSKLFCVEVAPQVRVWGGPRWFGRLLNASAQVRRHSQRLRSRLNRSARRRL